MVLSYDAYSETLEQQKEEKSEMEKLRRDVDALTKLVKPG
jgi:hypothetical protein